MGHSAARGTLIYEKNLKLKILCQTPFKLWVGPLCSRRWVVEVWRTRWNLFLVLVLRAVFVLPPSSSKLETRAKPNRNKNSGKKSRFQGEPGREGGGHLDSFPCHKCGICTLQLPPLCFKFLPEFLTVKTPERKGEFVGSEPGSYFCPWWLGAWVH